MQARIVTAARGAIWLAEGWRLFRVAPLNWLALVFTYWLLMTVLSVLPLLGVVAASVLVPAFSVGFMAAARAAANAAPVALGLLFEGFRHQPARQVILGAVYFACLGLVLGASALVDDGVLARLLLTGARPTAEAAQSDALLAGFATAALLYAPVMMMFWFAPPLAAWHAVAPAKALFFSFFACLMNWRAFLAYGFATTLVALVLPFLVLSAMTLASGGALRVAAISLVFPLLLILMPTLFASFYASYRDVFAEEPGTP